MPLKINFEKIKRARLSINTPGVSDFKNSEQDMVDFIQKDALKDQEKHVGTTWTWILDDKVLVGFVSLAMFSIDRRDMPKDKQGKYPYSTIPSLLIGQLATHSEYECNGLGVEMIKFAVSQGHEASQLYGCRTVALHPLPSATSWYQKKTTFKQIERDGANIMYFDLMPNPIRS